MAEYSDQNALPSLLEHYYGDRDPRSQYRNPLMELAKEDVARNPWALPPPPRPYSGEIKNLPPRPADAMAPVSEALWEANPIMQGKGLADLLADTYGKGREGDWGGAASNLPWLLAGTVIPFPGKRIAPREPMAMTPSRAASPPTAAMPSVEALHNEISRLQAMREAQMRETLAPGAMAKLSADEITQRYKQHTATGQRIRELESQLGVTKAGTAPPAKDRASIDDEHALLAQYREAAQTTDLSRLQGAIAEVRDKMRSAQAGRLPPDVEQAVREGYSRSTAQQQLAAGLQRRLDILVETAKQRGLFGVLPGHKE